MCVCVCVCVSPRQRLKPFTVINGRHISLWACSGAGIVGASLATAAAVIVVGAVVVVIVLDFSLHLL